MLGDIGPGGRGAFLVGDNYNGFHDRLHVCSLGRGGKQRLGNESRYHGDLGKHGSEGDVLEHVAVTRPHSNRSRLPHGGGGFHLSCGRKVTQLEYADLQPERAYYPAKRSVPLFTGKGDARPPPELALAA